MPSTAEMQETRSSNGSHQLLFVSARGTKPGEWLSALAGDGYRVRQVSDPREAEAALGGDRPAVVVLNDDGAGGSSYPSLRRAARERGVPILDVLDEVPDSPRFDLNGEDDWVLCRHAEVELPSRVARLVARSEAKRSSEQSAGSSPFANAHFFSLVVHDMRTPLNVIGLSLRMIGQAVPKGDPDLDEDLRFIDENFKQIERMLAQLSDYCRLFESELRLTVTEFSPQRLLNELLEMRTLRAGSRGGSVRLEVLPSCPEEVSLDPGRAQSAIQYALVNALAAAGHANILVSLQGSDDRWVTEIVVDRPPPSSVKAFEMRPDGFERLCGTAAERRGMDLAIAARISELFSGAVRFELRDQSSAIVLDWPARITSAGA